MQRKRSSWTMALLFAAFALIGYGPMAAAADYPTARIEMVVHFAPGGPADILGRALAEAVSPFLGQPVVVFNRPGASGTIGNTVVLGAKPDGYTILLDDNIASVFQPMRLKLPYKGPQDFTPIIKVADSANALVVAADSKWKTLADFVADAKARPGALRVATAGKFTGTDINVVEFNKIAGIKTTTVPVSGGTGPSVVLLLGGHVEAIAAGAAAVVGQVHAGKLRVLTMFGKRRSPVFPDVPTATELGYKTTMTVMYFISAPKGLGKAERQTLNAAFHKALLTPKFEQFAKRNGYYIDALDPQALRKELDGWRVYFKNLSAELGLK
ncbi:MAG TPA: tripartite tricarboxylate transporter substrate binding protein [Candidatus Binataceae bacterium]|nr:tripartite tricarboxylate transporter substrate binding protein [Candidatus Binataceae bacterium]